MGLMEKGQFDLAIASFREALKGTRDERKVRNALGIAYQRKGDLPAAAIEFQKVIEIDPASADAHLNYGGLLMVKRGATNAEREFPAAPQIHPRFTEAGYNLGALGGRR